VVELVLFVVPLGLDTFAVAAALGLAGIPARERLRASLVMAGFEAAMPIVGLFAGRGVGAAAGRVGDYVAAGVLFALGAWMLLGDEDGAETAARLGRGGLVALAGLGLAVSLDELAMGFSIGLLHRSIALAVLLIAAQAFVVAQLGLRLGARVGARGRDWAERLAAVAVIGLGALVLAERL
jgi:putative Mn2+ efflux pump MntP